MLRTGAATVLMVMPAILATLACAGCAPSDPEPTLVALRKDDALISVLVSVCDDDSMRRAVIRGMGTDGAGPVAWEGSGLSDDAQGSIRLNEDGWAHVSGSYEGIPSIDIAFETEQTGFGTIVEDVSQISGLKPGEYWVEGSVISGAGYRAIVDAECGPS